jgi:glyoxylase-like metal-dependent hydrolase (beta-lactamase superfamily II)
MPAEVKILLQGFTNADSVEETGEERMQPTVTLVKDGDFVIVCDPGVMRSQDMLIEALAKEGLAVKDVNVVFISHSHIDHFRNIGLFPDAKVLDFYGIWHEDTVDEWEENFSPNIKILHTPGHDYTSITLFANTENGVVAVCGDVFWKENYPRDPKNDAFASNPDRLKDSREQVVKMADWIVPGHGPMYKNGRSIDKDSVDVVKEKEPKIVVMCKKCDTAMKQKDKCQCRPYLCFRCCECCFDCDTCSCSHRKK